MDINLDNYVRRREAGRRMPSYHRSNRTIGRTRPNEITSFLIRYLDHDTVSLIGKIEPFLDRDFVACQS